MAYCSVAEKSIGKGDVVILRPLLGGIEEEYKKELAEEWDRYRKSMAALKRRGGKGEEPVLLPEEPRRNRLFVHSLDTNGATYVKWLSETSGVGIMFGTEIDDLSVSKNGRFGGTLSSSIRKNTENEPLSSERVDRSTGLLAPHAATYISGQPSRLRGLFGDTEDGLFSRFFFLVLPATDDFTETFEDEHKQTRSIRDVVRSYAPVFTAVYKALRSREKPMEITFPTSINVEYQSFMDDFKKAHLPLYGSFFHGSINRWTILIKRLAANFALQRKILDAQWFSRTNRLEVSVVDVRLAMRYVLARHPSLIQVARMCFGSELNQNVSSRDKLIFDGLPETEFTFGQIRELVLDNKQGTKNDAAVNRAAHRLIKRWVKELKIESTGERGMYRKKVVH